MIRPIVRLAVAPLLGYAAAYIALTFPLILQFNGAYFCDDGDGPQTIWNIWWVRHTIVDLHRSIFFTPELHWPVGSSLWLHSLSPMTGLLGLPLSAVLNSVQVYNILMIFCFAGAGLTAFWLAWDQTRAYWPSLAAGYIYTFCAFHFAHEPGHLHQTAIEFLPLYVLALVRVIRKPTPLGALLTSLALTIVLLCDHYQFLEAILITIILVAFQLRSFLTREMLLGMLIFAMGSAALIGPLLLHMARDAAEPQTGIHDPDWFAADLLSLFVPGRVWHFHAWTAPVWEAIGHYTERSVSIGIAALVAAAMARSHRSFSPARWWMLASLFVVLALGPTLRVDNVPICSAMPYRLLWRLPVFRLAGCPARLMLSAQLSISVLAATGLARLGSLHAIRSSHARTLLATLFAVGLILETEPNVQASFPADPEPWMVQLRDLPIRGAVIDLRTADTALQLYAQTIHGRPMAFGYLARVPDRIKQTDLQVESLVEANRYADLAAMGFGAIVDSASQRPRNLSTLYRDRQAVIYQLPVSSQTSRFTRAGNFE